eukprot:2144784-Amphidinium_carterae.2
MASTECGGQEINSLTAPSQSPSSVASKPINLAILTNAVNVVPLGAHHPVPSPVDARTRVTCRTGAEPRQPEVANSCCP